MSKLEISTRVKRLSTLLKEFEEGKILIPPFQRDYVWDNKKKIELLDSLNKGFPIGSVLFWMPDKTIRENFYEEDSQVIGGYRIESIAPEYYFILDGFQRLSTLFGCFINKNTTHLKQNEIDWKKEYDIFYDLKEDKFDFNRKSKSSLEIFQIQLYNFFDGSGYFELSDKLLTISSISKDDKLEYLERYKNFANKIGQYDIPVMELYGGDVKESVNIFSRLNSRGEIVSDDWKVSALSFNKERDFRFGTEIDNLFNYLEKYNFYTSDGERKSKRNFILDCVINSISDKAYFDVANTTDELERLASDPSFIDISLNAISTIKETIKFLYENLLTLNNKFISSNYQLTFLLDFFKNPQNNSNYKIEELKKWFWITSYTNYFTIYNLSDIREAYRVFQDFVYNGSSPVYKKNYLKVKRFPDKNNFGSSRYTALALFMVNYSINKDQILTSARVDSDQITGVNEYKLFRGKNSIGNTIFLPIQNDELNFYIKRRNSAEILLFSEFKGQFKELFITDEMRYLYGENRFEEIIILRESLIEEKERNFILYDLGLELETND